MMAIGFFCRESLLQDGGQKKRVLIQTSLAILEYMFCAQGVVGSRMFFVIENFDEYRDESVRHISRFTKVD